MRQYTLETIAIACHNVNRTYCTALGDTSQPPWCETPQWQKDSAIAGVRHVLDGTVTTPEQGHDSWLNQKVDDGWEYGEVKDPEKKTHPCLVPYIQLPAEQQAKDALFFAVVNGMRGDL